MFKPGVKYPKAFTRDQFKRTRSRLKAILVLGGKCSCCGWSEHEEGLEIDHANEDGRFERRLGIHQDRTYARIIAGQAHTCRLLCANCHRSKTLHARKLERSGEPGPALCFHQRKN